MGIDELVRQVLSAVLSHIILALGRGFWIYISGRNRRR